MAEEPAEDQASMQGMMQALTDVLQGLRVQQAPPPVKIAKYRGSTKADGDLSLKEWLDDFQSYANHYNLTGKAKAQSLLDHLAGSAKEEILCREGNVREDYDQIVTVLKSLFGPIETVPSLTREFHNRNQKDVESLADFSRVLMRLYTKMVKAAAVEEDKDALKRLRDYTLKERFVHGAKEGWVRRELRRIEMQCKDKTFLEMREEVLQFFKDEEPRHQARVCEVSMEHSVEARRVEEPALKEEIAALKNDVAMLTKSVQSLINIQSADMERAKELKCYNCGKKGHAKTDCTEETLCFNCKGRGHYSRNCPEKPKEKEAKGPGTKRMSTTPMENTELVDRLVAKSPCGDVEIGGIMLGCIFDTGAEASIIPSSLYHDKLKKNLGELQPASGIFLNVIGVGGIEIPIKGYIEVPIEVNGQNLMGSFLVVSDQSCTQKDTKYPLVIGCNILRHLVNSPIQSSKDVVPAIRKYKIILASEEDKMLLASSKVMNESDVHNKCADALSRCPSNTCVNSSELKSDLNVIASCLMTKVEGGSIEVNSVVPTVLPSFSHEELSDMQKNEDVFSKGIIDVGRCAVISHQIKVTEGPLIRFPYRRINPSLIPRIAVPLHAVTTGMTNKQTGKAAVFKTEDEQKEAANREAARHDSRTTDFKLEVGNRVLLKRNAFTGRHKLSDKFQEVTPVIIDMNEEQDIYEVRPAMGGISKWVNRRQLHLDPRGQESDVLEDHLPIFVSDENSEGSEEEDDEDDALLQSVFTPSVENKEIDNMIISVENKEIDNMIISVENEEIDNMITSVENKEIENQVKNIEDMDKGLRRSSRLNKGKHGNPCHLPTSAVGVHD
ncbi:uncharacterized protein [Antedon mediterranea]|uniref:uncharacterized protein n=1 Tax=Antedon mediterranea TaxID=105859 RepID=UPI003AF911DC